MSAYTVNRNSRISKIQRIVDKLQQGAYFRASDLKLGDRSDFLDLYAGGVLPSGLLQEVSDFRNKLGLMRKR